MKKLLFLFPAILLIYSCKKENQMPPYGAFVDGTFEFSLHNMQNEDLLDPNNPNHIIDTANIKVFYEKDGKLIAYQEPRYIHSKGYTIYQHPDGYRAIIHFNLPEKSGNAKTYIEWNNKLRDTLEASFFIPENSYSVYKQKVWLNGKLIWNFDDGTKSLYNKIID